MVRVSLEDNRKFARQTRHIAGQKDGGVSRGGGAGNTPQRLGFLFYSHLIRVR